MKEIVPQPPAEVRQSVKAVQGLFEKNVVPSYARFDLAFSHGAGSYLWDVTGRRYLDLGGGIAVCALGHSHPEVAETLAVQGQKLLHVSNLYFHEGQGRLAEKIVKWVAPGKCFFSNSGAEANEGLFKLARKFGHVEGRFEILTAVNSFHGRTLAGIAATGQEKVKKGFEPATPGFRHIPYNDLEAARNALSPATVAIMIEGIQGEGGITPARPDYLLGLRKLCDEHKLLLLIDAVQCGYFRTGRFQSFQRILEESVDSGFLPDGISMAKSLGGGFPIGAFWARGNYGDLLGPGTHGTTFGGTPLGCAIALKIFEVVEREGLAENARSQGKYLMEALSELVCRYPRLLQRVRGVGLMIGLELEPTGFPAGEKLPAAQLVNSLHQAGMLTIPAGSSVVRFLPALNLRRNEAEEGISILESVLKGFNR